MARTFLQNGCAVKPCSTVCVTALDARSRDTHSRDDAGPGFAAVELSKL